MAVPGLEFVGLTSLSGVLESVIELEMTTV
jgi:hypothetical protein